MSLFVLFGLELLIIADPDLYKRWFPTGGAESNALEHPTAMQPFGTVAGMFVCVGSV